MVVGFIGLAIARGGEEAAVVRVGEAAIDGTEGGVVGEEVVGVVDPRGVEGGEALGESVAGERGALEEGGA